MNIERIWRLFQDHLTSKRWGKDLNPESFWPLVQRGMKHDLEGKRSKKCPQTWFLQLIVVTTRNWVGVASPRRQTVNESTGKGFLFWCQSGQGWTRSQIMWLLPLKWILGKIYIYTSIYIFFTWDALDTPPWSYPLGSLALGQITE